VLSREIGAGSGKL
jgi:hypothetical protein